MRGRCWPCSPGRCREAPPRRSLPGAVSGAWNPNTRRSGGCPRSSAASRAAPIPTRPTRGPMTGITSGGVRGDGTGAGAGRGVAPGRGAALPRPGRSHPDTVQGGVLPGGGIPSGLLQEKAPALPLLSPQLRTGSATGRYMGRGCSRRRGALINSQ